MDIKFLNVFSVYQKPVSLVLVFVMIIQLLGATLITVLLVMPFTAEAAMVVIEGAPNTTAAKHTVAGSNTVFVNDQVGYKFYSPTAGNCVYRKTTNGGASWNSPVTVDSQIDCLGMAVWYDRWTPGDSGQYIHIATFDSGDDDLFYNRLDTTNDSLLLVTSTSTTLSSASIYAVATNRVSITKSTDGKIYMGADDGDQSNVVSCSSTCNVSTNWTNVGTVPQGNADSWSLFMPLASGNIMLINRSTSNTLRFSIWNGSFWSSMSNIDATTVRNTTYDVGMAATLDTDTGDIYISYTAKNDTFTVADHDLRTAVYNSGSWTVKTNIFTNVAGRGLLQTAISRDQNNGDIYVAYTIRNTIGTTNTARTYWVKSSDGMSSWGSEQGPVDTTAGDFYGIDMNIMSYDRIFVSWFDNVTAVRDIDGDTIADISPASILTATSTQNTTVSEDTSDFYVGGKFVLNTLSSRTISNVVINENGTIDADNNIANVKLFYDLDTSAPYDCASESYNAGSDSQFGSTVTGGFSGDNGSASFSVSPITISPTQTMCLYPVFDVLSTASDGDTIKIEVSNPKFDVLVSGGVYVYPYEAVAISGTTTVVASNLTQNGFHWRNDDGSESGATSATAGTENTSLSALQIGVNKRIRIGVSNQGSTTSVPSTYRLEYGSPSPTCSDAPSWTKVGDPGALFNLYDSTNLADGNNTTNIAVSSGGVTDGAASFIVSNGGVRDTTVDTGTLSIGVTQFLEFEYSVVASSSAIEGETYCFRMTRNGTIFKSYDNYPKATIASDVTVRTLGTQTPTIDIPTSNSYAGGAFSITENSSSHNVTSIKVHESGTVVANTGLSNLRLYYDHDTSAPYDCASESYSGTEAQFGATSTSGFSESGDKATFTGSVAINTTDTLCVYTVFDITDKALNAETIEIDLLSPAVDVVVSSSGTVGPSSQLNIASTTSLRGGIFTQAHYHWRNDNGTETGATSATGGLEDKALTDFAQNTNMRLRLGITNTGPITSIPTRFQLEYAPKITTCDIATVWTNVDASSDGWEMYDSTYLTNGETTTNIAVGNGGVTDSNTTFITSNGGVRDTESKTATTTISTTEHTDVEFSIRSNTLAAYDTTYCFRVSASGTPFQSYNNYAELTTSPKRDFYIQRGSTQVSGTSTTLIAGINYNAPASNTRAFVRITNSSMTGAGKDTLGGAQNADDTTAYIENAGDLITSFRIARPPAATTNTRVDWEIVEFIGNPGTDNEIVVRQVNTLQFNNSTLVATGSAVSNVVDNTKIAVFVTGSSNRNTSRNYYASQVTSEWNVGAQSPVFKRGANGSSIIDVSYAVVEFVGINWNIQRIEHSYSASGTVETEPITAVNSLAKTFIHAQKRMGATTNVVHFGHEVWLSSIGAVSFQLEVGADVAVEQTSVAWVIENIQTGIGAMSVQRSNGATTGGAEPLALSVILVSPMVATNNSSIMANSRGAGANTSHPRAVAGFTITSTSTYQIWRSDTGAALTYRTEIIEWPVADISLRQNYYRFYVENNALLPTDPWPAGVDDLGENTAITTLDEPLASGEKVRLRMTVKVANANLSAGIQDFKLQYGLRSSTCSAIAVDNWFDLGGVGSSTAWRGYSATGTVDGTSLSTDPPTGGDLLISLADRAGSLVHQNPSLGNPYNVFESEDVEYDWQVEHNGANSLSTYCFRMIRGNGTNLDVYNNYPQIRTAGFSPKINNWRWYSDIENETPTAPLAGEKVAPINVGDGDTLSLRLAVAEKRNVEGVDVKFKLQFSEDVTFATVYDVVATSSCAEHSLWCYVEGSGVNNNLIDTPVLSDGVTCTAGVGAGCGTYNTSPDPATGHIHLASSTQEYSFTIKNVAARVNDVYYFRLYDVTNDVPVGIVSGSSYPSMVTEGANLVFTIAGLPSGTTTSGVTTDATTTPSNIGFGSLSLDTDHFGAHRVTIESNATEGYQLFTFARQQLINSYGTTIPSITGTNATPTSWAVGCNASSTGCIGYHSTDATLNNGSTRFGASDTYAGLSATATEIMYSSIPTTDVHDIVYRIRVNELQEAGDYQTDVVYLVIPSF